MDGRKSDSDKMMSDNQHDRPMPMPANSEPARAIFDDLLPLYADGLLKDETVRWMERQAASDPELRQLLEQAKKPLQAPKLAPEPAADYEAAMRSLRRRLSVLQLILVTLSFGMAIGTSLLGGSFGFIFWYAVLGAVMYLFYRDWRLVLLVSFVPIFLWLFGDAIFQWLRNGESGAAAGTEMGAFRFLAAALGTSLLFAALHALFAFAGMAIVWLAKRKIPLTAALSVLLAAGVLLLYDAYNGNPLVKWLAEKKLEAYLENTHPDEQLVIGEGWYNFKNGAYEFRVVSFKKTADGQPAEYRVSLRGWNPRVISDGVRNARLDERMMNRLGAGAAAEIRALLERDVAGLRQVDVRLEVLQGELPDDAAWHKDLPVADDLRISIVLDAGGMTADDVREGARRIQAALDEAGYRYKSVLINANEFEEDEAGEKRLGPLKYAASFRPGDDVAKIKVRTYNQ